MGKYDPVFGTPGVQCGDRLRKYGGADILTFEGQGADGRKEENNAQNQYRGGAGKTRSIDSQDRPQDVQAAAGVACYRGKTTNASRDSPASVERIP